MPTRRRRTTSSNDLTREKFASVGKSRSERKKSRTFHGFPENVCLRIPLERIARERIERCAADPYQIRAYINTRDIRGVPRRPCFYFIRHRISPSVCRDFLFGIVDTWRASETRNKVIRSIDNSLQFYRGMDKLTCIN